uniref:Uncharacterized protein n=1 Tax=Glossina austeni TaxID=7395 RepID=A0A1A9V8E0_GLOAU
MVTKHFETVTNVDRSTRSSKELINNACQASSQGKCDFQTALWIIVNEVKLIKNFSTKKRIYYTFAFNTFDYQVKHTITTAMNNKKQQLQQQQQQQQQQHQQ